MLGDSCLNKLDAATPREFSDLITLRPLVAPSLHLGCSLRHSGH